jgi:hypothetical protein
VPVRGQSTTPMLPDAADAGSCVDAAIDALGDEPPLRRR